VEEAAAAEEGEPNRFGFLHGESAFNILSVLLPPAKVDEEDEEEEEEEEDVLVVWFSEDWFVCWDKLDDGCAADAGSFDDDDDADSELFWCRAMFGDMSNPSSGKSIMVVILLVEELLCLNRFR
jgi:hypothetical protein